MPRLVGCSGRWLPPLARLLVLRLGWAAGVLAVISMLIFAATEVLPGDAAQKLLGPRYTPQLAATVRHALHLDTAAPLRYLLWVGGILHGDLGTSIRTGRTVGGILGERLPDTVILAGLAFAAIVIVSLTLGLISGSRAGSRADSTISVAGLLAVPLPEFVIAELLVVIVATWLGLLPSVSLIPAGGTALDAPLILVLPLLTLTVTGSAYSMRLVRAAVIDAGALPHVEAARLRGLSEREVLIRHLLPSALGPIAQVFAYLSGCLVGGTIVVEQVFNYPGVGRLLVESVDARDVTVVQGVGLLGAAAVVGAFLLADLIGLLANPRLRTAA